MKYTVIHIINIFTVLKAIHVFIMSVQISSKYANPFILGSKHVLILIELINASLGPLINPSHEMILYLYIN